MKALKNIRIKAFLMVILLAIIPAMGYAQYEYKKYFANGDWQFNVPLNNDFTSTASGWGMSFEGGYFVAPRIGLGLFMSYSTNHKYIDTATLPVGTNASINTNQQRSLFQLPFGMVFRYRMTPYGWMDPYFSLKLGTEYTQLSSYISTYQIYERKWGFYMSPEIGANMWLTQAKNIGFNISLYYSFATNKGAVLDGNIDKLNNFGFRIGLAF